MSKKKKSEGKSNKIVLSKKDVMFLIQGDVVEFDKQDTEVRVADEDFDSDDWEDISREAAERIDEDDSDLDEEDDEEDEIDDDDDEDSDEAEEDEEEEP